MSLVTLYLYYLLIVYSLSQPYTFWGRAVSLRFRLCPHPWHSWPPHIYCVKKEANEWMPPQHLVPPPLSREALKTSEGMFSLPFCGVIYLNINKWFPSLSVLIRQLCFWGKMAEGREACWAITLPEAGMPSWMIQERVCRTWNSILYGKERQTSLDLGVACVVFSKDRKARPFEEFPVVLLCQHC